MTIAINTELAKKVISTVDAGLISGLGEATPGSMCVEAAICFAMGEKHSDAPTCVGSAVREFMIQLNDSNWPSGEDRTKGLRKLSIAQLGSDTIDQMQFSKHVALQCQRRLLPFVLRHAASFKSDWSERLIAVSKELENAHDLEECKALTLKAKALCNDAIAYANAYAIANAIANAANAYAIAYAIANAELRLKLLNLLAEIGLDALIECKSPGCEYLHLCEVV